MKRNLIQRVIQSPTTKTTVNINSSRRFYSSFRTNLFTVNNQSSHSFNSNLIKSSKLFKSSSSSSLPLINSSMSQYSSSSQSGPVKKIIKEGDKKNYPKKGDNLVMHYTGRLTNGKVFDSSVERNSPFQFQIGVGQVIKGWDVLVMQMSVGEKSELVLPPDYAYGASGAGGVIPPNATLIFEVELLEILG